ncbi:MAG: TlpA family protein disulfide reductase [Planctomycetes bacterium]|nr:TlpA family protein disulfide reductase [Planctomycetota bacterium]
MAPPCGLDKSTPNYRAWLDSPGGDIAFGLELQRSLDEKSWQGWLHNGAERVSIGSVSLQGSVMTLRFDPYDSYIEATLSPDHKTLEGEWIRYHGPDKESRLPFHARLGSAARYPSELNGNQQFLRPRYRVQFSEDKHHAVAIFNLAFRPNKVSGTFLTTLGDYRYLEGIFDGVSLTLSCFDGAHAFLFKARMQDDGSLKGDFWSRDSWHETWTAAPDKDVALPDPFNLSKYVDGVDLSKLSFPDPTGTPRRLDDPEFAGKARLIVLLGTWCPNCNDQTEYMVALDKKYRKQGLSILGLAFELGDDFERNARTVNNYIKHHKAKFPILIAGTSDKKEAAKHFPALDTVLAYPTTLFIDHQDKVQAVYTGFAGPATGLAHSKLRQAFETKIDTLLKQAQGH